MYGSAPSSNRSAGASNPSWMHSPTDLHATPTSYANGRDDYGGDNGDDDDDDDGDLEAHEDLRERDPLLGSSSVLSPSTGSSSSLLRRNFRGLKAKRNCTDVAFLALFVCYWLGMVALALYAFTRESNASFAKYIKDGVDFQGDACGSGRFVYFPDFRVNPDFGFCVDACPEIDGQDMEVALPLETSKLTKNGSHELVTVHFKSYATHPWTYVCAPAQGISILVETEATMIAQLQDNLGRFVGALGECWEALIISSAITFGTAALYLIFLRYCGCFTVFFSALGIQGILTYGSYELLLASTDPLTYPNDPAMKSSLQFAAVVMTCCAVLFLLLALMMLPRLILAGTFITHASRALHQLKKLLFVPILSFAMLLVLFYWAIIVTICLFGAGETSTRVAIVSASSPSSIQIQTQSFRIHTELRWWFIYLVWGIYWSANFILAIGEMITATAVSLWYFSATNKVTSEKLMKHVDPVAYAVKSTLRYHLGTLAMSSAIVTPVGAIRQFFMYLENKNEMDSNTLTEWLATCCCCCIWCFKSCLKFICKEAYYITAIQGTSFYPSGKLASTLIGSNLLRIGALSRIGHASVLLGKLIVCATTGFISWFLLKEVSSPLLPLLAIMLFSYGVAHAFMTIYETTINMLLLCFTLDENMHGGRGNAAFAPAALRRSVDDHLRPKWQTVL